MIRRPHLAGHRDACIICPNDIHAGEIVVLVDGDMAHEGCADDDPAAWPPPENSPPSQGRGRRKKRRSTS